MPYTWTETSRNTAELRLWPHQSLPARGFAATILGIFTLWTIPLYGLLGTLALWGVLPFVLIALAAMWYALRRNDRDRQILETLRLNESDFHLIREAPNVPVQEWHCNPYWTRVNLHAKGGPVPHYVTLSGAGREVEIGAFLSEEERKALFAELSDTIRRIAAP
ncbi:DUF2244 domain-containing protein [Marivita sp. GX14005]|uniref:DUF2244 domain-containing protein n=1 Tax=Marivita sp. GX14005 TaxID=2942276 RepID=UPI002018E2DD|nr:DUF2244 domain-containing protein [Marivita sp. GX14005]MCL3883014.1 DUF2244 domain-containing protein [Marivita sp. GX14005]